MSVMYLVSISKKDEQGRWHNRHLEVVELPSQVVDVKGSLKTKLQEVWSLMGGEFPGESLSSVRIDYVQMSRLGFGGGLGV